MGEGSAFPRQDARGYEIEFDGHIQWGCAPTESLLLSLSGLHGDRCCHVPYKDEGSNQQS